MCTPDSGYILGLLVKYFHDKKKPFTTSVLSKVETERTLSQQETSGFTTEKHNLSIEVENSK